VTKALITGFSALAATGLDAESIWQALLAQRSGIRPISAWDTTGWDYRLAAEIADYQPRKLIKDRKLLKLLSRQDVIGLAAVEQAIDNSGLLAHRDSQDAQSFNDRTGVFVASPGNKFIQQYDFMPLLAAAKQDWSQFGEQLFSTVHPTWLLRILPNNVLAYTGIQYGFMGPNHNFTNHVCGGLQALAEARAQIQQGLIDRAIVVAYESGAEPQGVQHYAALGLLSQTDLKPFASDRDGTILGEGAAVIILESEAAAKARGALVYGEVLAAHSSSEACGVFGIDHSGAGLATHLQALLARAEIDYADVAMVTAHANGNKAADAADVRGLSEFAQHQTPITGFKWSLGHTLTAAGPLETIMTLLALRAGVVPGIANLSAADAEREAINLCARSESIEKNIGVVYCRGFGSFNASVLIKSC
jgi:3-oxoacyl-[acyl-carrier-protein] synthase I